MTGSKMRAARGHAPSVAPAGTSRSRVGMFRAAIGMAVLFALASAAPAAAADAVFEGAGCDEAVAAIPVEAGRARAELPEGWRPVLDRAGLAALGVGVLRCDRLMVGDDDLGAGSISDVGILVESPDNTEGSHFYQLWQHTTAGALHGLTSALGIPGSRRRMEWRLTSPFPFTNEFEGKVVDRHGGYGITGTASPAVETGPSAPTWWHDGKRGRTRISYALRDTRTAAGLARLRAAPGSRLADLSADRTVGAGLLIALPSFRAEVSLRRRR